MNEPIAREILNRELSFWRTKPYAELVKLIGKTQTAEAIGQDEKIYQVEIQVLWDSKRRDNIRVTGSLDDGAWGAFKPLTDSFIVAPNGAFVDEH